MKPLFTTLIAFFLIFSLPAAASKHRGRWAEILSIFQTIETAAGNAESCNHSLTPSSEESVSLTLETERFTLAPLARKDIPALSQILLDEKVAEYTGEFLQEYQVAQLVVAGKRAESFRVSEPHYLINFGIWEKGNLEAPRLAGIVTLAMVPPFYQVLLGKVLPTSRWLELSYALAPEFWNKFTAPEVLYAVTKFAFENLNVKGLSAKTPLNRKPQSLLLAGFKVIAESQPVGPGEKSRYFSLKSTEALKEGPKKELLIEADPKPEPEPTPSEPEPKTANSSLTTTFLTGNLWNRQIHFTRILPIDFFSVPHEESRREESRLIELLLVQNETLNFIHEYVHKQRIYYGLLFEALDHGITISYEGSVPFTTLHNYLIDVTPNGPVEPFSFRIQVERSVRGENIARPYVAGSWLVEK